jgi:OTT_1508-like deaminase
MYDMHIRPVPSHPKVIFSLPNSASEWEPLVETVCKSQETKPKEKGWYLKEGEGIHRVFGGGEKEGIVHCECNLIAYLEKTPNGRVPPFSYIGTSKPNCAPCYLWIQQFNAVFRSNYQTRGTDSKWYKYWAMPTISNVQQQSRIEKAFVGEVIKEYCEELKIKGHFRSNSSSSDAYMEEMFDEYSKEIGIDPIAFLYKLHEQGMLRQPSV